MRSERREQTPDLSALIQELVDQNEWKEGNALVSDITGTDKRASGMPCHSKATVSDTG